MISPLPRDHVGKDPPAVEICHFPPGPGNGRTYTSKRPDSSESSASPVLVVEVGSGGFAVEGTDGGERVWEGPGLRAAALGAGRPCGRHTERRSIPPLGRKRRAFLLGRGRALRCPGPD